MRKALHNTFAFTALASSLFFAGCSEPQSPQSTVQDSAPELLVDDSRLGIYHQVPLTADLSHLSDNQKQMLSKLIDASKIMDDLFWKQAFFGNKDEFLQGLSDQKLSAFA